MTAALYERLTDVQQVAQIRYTSTRSDRIKAPRFKIQICLRKFETYANCCCVYGFLLIARVERPCKVLYC